MSKSDPSTMPLFFRWEGKHLTMDVRDYGPDIVVAIWGHASWRKWNLHKRIKGHPMWLIKYIERLLAALEESHGA